MGLALCWKAPGIASQKYLGELKRIVLPHEKGRYGIGHSGTLDPFAEGLLLVAWGEGTKLLAPLFGFDKKYRATIALGLSSATLDTEDVSLLKNHQSKNFLELAEKPKEFWDFFLKTKIGVQKQRPPEFSAVKVKGQRSYDLARKGKSVELPEREVEIKSLTHLGVRASNFSGFECLEWEFEVEVSSGTYIRSLARDWSLELCGEPSCLNRLIRIRIGPFDWENHPSDGDLLKSWKWLSLDGLKKVFDIIELSGLEKEKLLKGGAWQPREIARNALLVGPEQELLAWCEAPRGTIGRVFNSNPLS